MCSCIAQSPRKGQRVQDQKQKEKPMDPIEAQPDGNEGQGADSHERFRSTETTCKAWSDKRGTARSQRAHSSRRLRHLPPAISPLLVRLRTIKQPTWIKHVVQPKEATRVLFENLSQWTHASLHFNVRRLWTSSSLSPLPYIPPFT